MAYVPVVLDTINLEDKLFQNIYRILDEYKLSNTSITVEGNEESADYPSYTIYIPELEATMRDMRSTNKKRVATIIIEYNCLPVQGYRQLTLMSDALERGLDLENNNLRVARLRYKDYSSVSNTPIDVSGQRVFSKIKAYNFEVLL